MNFWYAIQTALGNLRANKLRSLLTMLGVIIGVGAVIIMVAIVQGASERVTSEFSGLGSNLMIIFYQLDPKDRNTTTRRIDAMKMDDVRAILSECSLVKSLSAELPINQGPNQGSTFIAKYRDKETEINPNGVQPDYERLRNVKVARGRFISEDDLTSWAKVCVIGDKVRAELFKDEDPMGREVQVNGVSLTVVGIMEKKGRSLDGDADKNVYVPLTTVQKRYIGRELVGVIWAEPKDPKRINEAMEQVWQLLMRRYDNLPGFHVDSQENILASINKILTVFGIILGSIAGLSLLVGGIGIMNIMLVSVTERTREIGIRKAIGATRRDILLQFLIESATVSATGGIIGLLLGAGTAYTIGYITTFIPGMENPQTGAKGLAVYVSPVVCLLSFAFSAGVGILFGVYPAYRAASLDPIEALRHE